MSVAGVKKVTLVSCKKKNLSLNTRIDAGPIIGSFRPHYGSGVESASNRNEYQE
jgi:hypothetical protein